MPVSLTKEEAHAFLDSRPGWVVLTTIGKNGFPHSVPIGYFRLDDDIYLGGRSGTQRVRNIERNAKVSLLIESGKSMQDIKGLMIQGEASIVANPDEVLPLMRAAAKQRGTSDDELPAEARPGVAYVRVRPSRYISWDYSREE